MLGELDESIIVVNECAYLIRHHVISDTDYDV